MSVGSENLETVYSRLLQSTSDIETSEDEISQHENLIYYRKLATPKPIELTKEGNSQLIMGDYQPLGHDRGTNETHEVHINGFSNVNYSYAHGSVGSNAEDEMMALGTIGTSGKLEGEARHGNRQLMINHRNPMSAMRRVAFVMSVCLCIFTIVAFLWVLPCDWATCSIMQNSKLGGSSWEKELMNMELIGGINIVPSENQHHNNILFLVRGEMKSTFLANVSQRPSSFLLTRDTLSFPVGVGGFITLRGSTGSMMWVQNLTKVPRVVDCSLVDLDGSGQNDCVLVGEDDLLCAFNPVTSTMLWFLHNDGDDLIPTDMDFPLVLPDLDGDGVSELLLICNLKRKSSHRTLRGISMYKTDHNYLLIVSGKVGSIFGSPYAVPNCLYAHDLRLDKDWYLSFTCDDAFGKDSAITMPLNKLYTLVKNRSTPYVLDHSKYPDGGLSLNQHGKEKSLPNWAEQSPLQVSHPAKTLLEEQQTSFLVSGRKLTILNKGHCPQDCSALAYVSDERAGRNSTIWTDGGENMYVLYPALLSFSDRSISRSSGALLGPVSGFVLKFWHWTPNPAYGQSTWANQTRSRLKRMNSPPDKGVLLHFKKDESPPSMPLSTNSAIVPPGSTEGNSTLKIKKASRSISGANNDVSIYRLKERIVLVTFNETNMHLVNASESEILQMCLASECQPSLAFQEQSLIIADLDEDGSKELVSYLSTFTGKSRESLPQIPSPKDLKLMSKVRVVRLEAELPKLYETVTHTYDKSFDLNPKHSMNGSVKQGN